MTWESRLKPTPRRSRARKRGANPMATSQLFGMSAEAESSWQEMLSEAHNLYMLAYLERQQATEEATITEWHLGKFPNATV
jgi:hypothetical protein